MQVVMPIFILLIIPRDAVVSSRSKVHAYVKLCAQGKKDILAVSSIVDIPRSPSPGKAQPVDILKLGRSYPPAATGKKRWSASRLLSPSTTILLPQRISPKIAPVVILPQPNFPARISHEANLFARRNLVR